jgi:hypothetical protein
MSHRARGERDSVPYQILGILQNPLETGQKDRMLQKLGVMLEVVGKAVGFLWADPKVTP